MNKNSNYKGVGFEKRVSSGAKAWTCRYKGIKTYHHTEREAARNYDLKLIRDGKAPVNGTLTPKK